MPIAVLCPKCSKKLSAPDAMAGKKAKCPHCGQLMQLPVPRPSAPPTQEVLEDLSRSDPLGALGVSSRVPTPIGSTAPARSSAAVGAPSGAPAGSGFGGFDAQQFDEMLADVGPRLDVKPTEPQQERFPCPICHELIVRGSVKCRFCNTDFNQYAPPKKAVSSGAMRSYRNNMTALGVVWIILGLLSLVMMLVFMAMVDALEKAGKNIPIPGSSEVVFTILGICGVMWFTLGVFTCQKHIWAVWVGLVLSYLSLISNIVHLNFCGVVFLVPILALAHRCIYWKGQTR